LERFAAPLTVHVTSGMITHDIDAWWFGLARLIRAKERIDLPGLGSFDCSDRASKQRAFSAILAIHRDFRLLAPLRTALTASKMDCCTLVDALSPAQLRQLASHPLATVGAHTTTHRNLALASANDVHSEMAASRALLEAITGRPVVHFAYPFGHARACGAREAEIPDRSASERQSPCVTARFFQSIAITCMLCRVFAACARSQPCEQSRKQEAAAKC
jgi:peptidoglycan/xylan/chitin deacetylase (PgdA/CDA1 family)